MVKDIYCGIIISVKVGMARRTIPRAVLQRKLIIDCPAAVAGFGRWKPSVNLNDLAAVQKGFIFQNMYELSKA